MTLSDSRANVYVGRFRNTLGYRHTEYTQSRPFSHQGHHTNELCYQHQTYCDWMLFTPSQGYHILHKKLPQGVSADMALLNDIYIIQKIILSFNNKLS